MLVAPLFNRKKVTPMLSSLMHPSLTDCRRLFLRNYEVMINIGVYEFEKRASSAS